MSTSNYGAETGRSSGPQVSLVTKSGTNEFRGSGYWVMRRTATSSNEYFLKLAQVLNDEPSEAPKLDKDIWGGSIGGPVKRNKMYFFFNYERLKENSESPVVRAVPSDVVPRRRARVSVCGGFGLPGWQRQRLPNQPQHPVRLVRADAGAGRGHRSAGHRVRAAPRRRTSSSIRHRTSPGSTATTSWTTASQRPIENNFHTPIGRIDYRFNDNQSLFGRFNIQDDTINAAPQFPGGDPTSETLASNIGFAIGYDVAISPTPREQLPLRDDADRQQHVGPCHGELHDVPLHRLD